VPTIGSRAGGIPELVEHGKTGFLAPIGDTSAMAKYAVKLLSDEQMAEQFRKDCLERACEGFSRDMITNQYEDIYYRVLGRKAAGLDTIRK
jgi:glycosyltransferase involved in cell wall biosynthesis